MTTPTLLARTTAQMALMGVHALLIGPGAEMRHLIHHQALPLERLTLLVARADGGHSFVTPELERARVEADGMDLQVVSFGETDDPFALVASLLELPGQAVTLGVGNQLWAQFLLGLQSAMPEVTWIPATEVTRTVRMAKTPDEVECLRRAGQAIDRVHAAVPSLLRPGRTEAEVGADIDRLMREEGHADVDFVIVASGPNGASPHHETSERPLQPGDGIVVDIGGPVDGWFSDCTRNYVLGSPPEEYLRAYEVLRRAQQAAVDHVRPGVTAASVDNAAREVITEAGYGAAFIHRTGHGIGLEVHEEPYIVAGNDLPLEVGMTFSIEPGIYLAGRFGMRLEDIVAVTADGATRLNNCDHDVVVVPCP